MWTSWLRARSSGNTPRSGDRVDLKLFRTTLISCVRHLSNNISTKTSSDAHPEEAMGARSRQTGGKSSP